MVSLVSTGLPKQDSGHWWSSFFFGKQPGMTPLTEEAQLKYVKALVHFTNTFKFILKVG